MKETKIIIYFDLKKIDFLNLDHVIVEFDFIWNKWGIAFGKRKYHGQDFAYH